MSREVVWTKEAAKDLRFWKKNNIQRVERISKLIKSIQKEPFRGMGKPEPLKFSLAGCWSRRINREEFLHTSFRKRAIAEYPTRLFWSL